MISVFELRVLEILVSDGNWLKSMMDLITTPDTITFGYLSYGHPCTWYLVYCAIVLMDLTIGPPYSSAATTFNLIGFISSSIQAN